MAADRPGIGTSARRIGASLLRLGRIRLELLSLEVQEERDRITALMFWAVLSALTLGFGLVFVALAVTVLLWDTQRWAVLGVSAVVFCALAAYGLWRVRGLSQGGATLFGTSIDELRRDADALDDRAR